VKNYAVGFVILGKSQVTELPIVAEWNIV